MSLMATRPLMLTGFVLILAASAAAQQDKSAETQSTPETVYSSIVITSTPLEPAVERLDGEVFDKTLLGRDDQLLHVLGAGINAGQHEGGGKSLEIRRFGFNLDHGGAAGGLRILVDNVVQNQPTQAHGQGYLGALKSITPELVQEVNLINGPFAPEHGDFSSLGVVHIRMRESMPDALTGRVQAGSFHALRGFLAMSPELRDSSLLLAWEGNSTDGPFLQPLGYVRNNVTGSWLRRLSQRQSFSLRFNGGTNAFQSSGQIPLDEVAAGRLDRFGNIDPAQGGRAQNGTIAAYFSREGAAGEVLRADASLSRSLLDLRSNFTYLLNNPGDGDAITQHDSRLVEGGNLQYQRPHRVAGLQSLFTAGAGVLANQVLAGLDSRVGYTPVQALNKANANITNGSAYAQERVTLWGNRLQAGAALRYDEFVFRVRDRIDPAGSGTVRGGAWQPKLSLAFTPSSRTPLTLHASYGRGIATADARVIVQRPETQRISLTDFSEVGASWRAGRFSATADVFLIDRSAELVYLADEGLSEFLGPSRAWGSETRLGVSLTRRLSFYGGVTKVANSFYRSTAPREYVTNAPRFTANAGLTLSSWRGWSGSLRMRAINRYRLDSFDPAILAAGHTVWDLGIARRVRRGVDFNLTLDNLVNRLYWETQNYYESRLAGQEALWRIHATPGYPLTVMAGFTFRFFGK